MMQYLWMFLAALWAFSTGRGTIRWTLAAYFFGWMPLVVLVFLPVKKEKAESRVKFINDKTEEITVKNEFKNVNTVDDLFKQLETK